MLFYQFIDLVLKSHQKGMRFGFLNFQNLYFLKNIINKKVKDEHQYRPGTA